LAAVLAFAGCSLDKQTAPPLTGPSELGLSLAVTATPDVITQDGQSQSTIQVVARDSNGQLKSDPVTLRVETYIGGAPADVGVLSTKVATTDTTGVARLTYRAPAAPSAAVTSDTLVTVVVTPVGSDYAGATPRDVQIRLARPGVIAPPNNGLIPKFTVSPTTPKIGDTVIFDASASTTDARNITSYVWHFGDGDTATGKQAQHIFVEPGVVAATLIVTDDLGRTAETSTSIAVSAPLPEAKVVVSPTDPVPNELVFFTADVSVATPAREIVFYEWNFGDGSPLESGPDKRIVSHAYATKHKYVITLKVRDDLNRENVVSQEVNVGSATP
jgi:PKD repeat protein